MSPSAIAHITREYLSILTPEQARRWTIRHTAAGLLQSTYGLPVEQARRQLRFSVTPSPTWDECDEALETLVAQGHARREGGCYYSDGEAWPW
ncbi:MAG TPA: hypothetical protein VFH61_18075 [Thermoleophilia bacterium]|nr:hypothetical protein [Thermoleophilia bacterium]